MRTAEGPRVRVGDHVFLEARAKAETLAADGALMRTLARVTEHVALDVRATCVGLVALRAFELLAPAVALTVRGPLAYGVETLAALLAQVTLRGAVVFAVFDESGGRRAGFAADGAVMRQVAGVTLLVVGRQSAQVGEGAPAQLAGEGGLAVSLAAVFGQIPRVLEPLATLAAAERTLSRVGQLVSPHVGPAGKRSAAGVARVSSARVVGGRRLGFGRRLRLM